MLFDGTENEANEFMRFLNTVDNHIQLTIEMEKDKRLNFLDITLTRNNQRITFDIYRKPTHTDTLIQKDSNHPMDQKMASFRYLTDRVKNLPLTRENIKKEFDVITQLAISNGYDKNLIQHSSVPIQNLPET